VGDLVLSKSRCFHRGNGWCVRSVCCCARDRSVGHRVETHTITPAADYERGDIEIKDYVILPPGEDDRLPHHTLVMDVTMTHHHYGRTTQRTNRKLSHRVSSTGAPQPDGALNKAASIKIQYYGQVYVDRS
jgi:hypothetical protein